MAAYTAIDDPGLYFNTVLYTGDIVDGDGSGHTLAITGVGFGPNLVWHKCRSAAQPHLIVDTVRGTSSYNFLKSSETGAEVTANVNGAIKTIDSDGITVEAGTDSSSKSNVAGADGFTYAFWNWKESATAGFDIVSYTGNGSNRTIAHSLSATPDLVIIKRRSDTGDWLVGGSTTLGGDNKLLLLNTTAALDDNSEVYQSFSSSTFGIGVNAYVNTDSSTHIAYVFSGKQGFSKFGSYTGNGNADGTFVYTGFRPAWIIIKRSSTSGSDWHMHDTKRDPFNIVSADLYADANSAEDDSTDRLDILSNGIKIKNSNGAYNLSGGTYIYMAFAEAPFVNSNGVPCNAR